MQKVLQIIDRLPSGHRLRNNGTFAEADALKSKMDFRLE